MIRRRVRRASPSTAEFEVARKKIYHGYDPDMQVVVFEFELVRLRKEKLG